MIEFKKVTEDNFGEIIKLDTGEGMNKFVAKNVVSLAQAYVATENNTCTPMPFAVYQEDTLVGFIQLAYMTKEQSEEMDGSLYEIWRFMIDEKYQGKGYGKAALRKAIDFVKTLPCGEAKKLYLSYVPGNEKAVSLYKAVGFKETGDQSDGEIIMFYQL